MHAVTANYFRQHLKTEVDLAIENSEILKVTRKNGENFVVMGEQEWRDIEATIHLNQIPGMVESIYSASKEPLSKGTKLDDLKW